MSALFNFATYSVLRAGGVQNFVYIGGDFLQSVAADYQQPNKRVRSALLREQLRASVGLPSPDGPASARVSRSFHATPNSPEGQHDHA